MSGNFRVRASRPDDVPQLLEVWRRAVDATHNFLTSDDRLTIDRIVAEDYLPTATLMVAANSDDVPVAFLGGSNDEIESLFVDPSVYGQGVGRLLVEDFAAGTKERFESTLTNRTQARAPFTSGWASGLPDVQPTMARGGLIPFCISCADASPPQLTAKKTHNYSRGLFMRLASA